MVVRKYFWPRHQHLGQVRGGGTSRTAQLAMQRAVTAAQIQGTYTAVLVSRSRMQRINN